MLQKDKNDIDIITSHNISLRFFGSDLQLLEQRLQDPCGFLARYNHDYQFHVFVVATSNSSSLLRDFRAGPERGRRPEDRSIEELQREFPADIARGIITASKWMLCAPYVSGSLPTQPGWVPVFNSQTHVNLRAYIPTFEARENPVIWMKGELFCHVFGLEQPMKINEYMSQLWTRNIIIKGTETPEITNAKAQLQLNLLQNLAEQYLEPGQKGIVVVQAIHRLDMGITVDIT